jgi:arylsulfatase A-like enzyme
MTGRWPHELSADWTTPLDDVHATLAETLSGRGYATAGFAANSYYCGFDSGLARGFVHYEAGAPGWWQVLRTTRLGLRLASATWLRRAAGQYSKFGRWNAPEVSASLLRWIDRNPGRPFFAFVNYFDAHGAYDPPPPYDSALAGVAPRTLFDLTPGSPWTPEQVAAERLAYEGAITVLDRQLGELFEQLRALAFDARSLS